MDCKLQVFKLDREEGNSTATYRFAVVDCNKSKRYPANFVCMLPSKVDLVKGKNANVFGGLFGDKSLEFAIDLLNKALKSESDAEVKTEIERRLKLIDPKQATTFKCRVCKKTFQAAKTVKYKQQFCKECYRKRFARQYWV